MRVADLTPADRPQLERFDCGPGRRIYTSQLVQHQFSDALPWCLENPDEAPDLHAIGLFDDDELCAVATFGPSREDPEHTWTCDTVAVKAGRHGQGLGRRLKQEVLDRARALGARVLVSIVHEDNTPMLRINAALGATITPDEIRTEERFCVIVLDETPAPGGAPSK